MKIPFIQVLGNIRIDAGWILSETVSEFASADGSKVLKGAEFSFKNDEVKIKDNNVSKQAIHHDVIFNNNDV